MNKMNPRRKRRTELNGRDAREAPLHGVFHYLIALKDIMLGTFSSEDTFMRLPNQPQCLEREARLV